jgi:hypothetical protein
MNTKNVVIEICILTLAVVGMFTIMYIAGPNAGKKVVIDCSLSEISPDFTNDMRKACRQARAKNP